MLVTTLSPWKLCLSMHENDISNSKENSELYHKFLKLTPTVKKIYFEPCGSFILHYEKQASISLNIVCIDFVSKK